MLKTDSISYTQINIEKRWDVKFNIELKLFKKNHFNLKTVEEISEHITNGATPLGADFPEQGVNFFKATDIRKFTFDFVNHMYIRPEESKNLKRSILYPNDIICTIKGKVGDVSVFPKGLTESNINQDNALIRLKEGYDPYYIAAVFNSKFGLNQMRAFTTETINPFLGLGNLKKLKIPFIDEKIMDDISFIVKKTIYNDLESISLIEKAKKILRDELNLNDFRIQKTFSVNLSSFVDSGLWIPKYSYPVYVNTLNDIKNKFDIVKLGDIADISSGNEVGRENYIKYIDRSEEDVPFIRTSDIVNYVLDLYPANFVSADIQGDLNQDNLKGDVLFTKDGKIGVSGMITEMDNVVLSSGIARIRINSLAKKYDISPEYLFLILSITETGIYPAIRRTVVASTIPHLRTDKLNDFEIPILNKEVMDNISRLVNDAFNIKNNNKILIKEIINSVDDELS